MKKNNSKTATGASEVKVATMTKQEKYEKKMAKYAANKARKAQLENERKEASHQKNENRKAGFDPSRLMYGQITGIDKMYIGKSYTFEEMMYFQMGYNETNCPTSARTGSKDYVYVGNGAYATVEKAKSMGISVR